MRRLPGIREFPMPKWPNSGRYGWCKWCGKEIPVVIDGKRSTQRMWHPACWDEVELHTRAAAQYDFLVARDGERCRLCPEATPKPMRWKHGPNSVTLVQELCLGYGQTPAEEAWWNDFWNRPPGRWADLTEEERRTGEYFEIERVCALEVDHRIPLWLVSDLPDEERRWYFGPGNLWLLCPWHHAQKTARETTERAALRAFARAQLTLQL